MFFVCLLIQQYLDENEQLILAILDNQNAGKAEECAEKVQFFINKRQMRLLWNLTCWRFIVKSRVKFRRKKIWRQKNIQRKLLDFLYYQKLVSLYMETDLMLAYIKRNVSISFLSYRRNQARFQRNLMYLAAIADS